MSRPKIAPIVWAALTERAPGRLVRKLDKSPELAEGWRWVIAGEVVAVTTDSDETVMLRPRDGILQDETTVSCSCLLAPRCLHLLAVASRLEIAEGEAHEERVHAGGSDSASLGESAEGQLEVEPRQAMAAAALWAAASSVLNVGAVASGAMAQAELARAVYSARAAGLHRAASAGTRVIAGVRQLRARKSEFTLPAYTADLLETLRCSGEIVQASKDQRPLNRELLGVARRVYGGIGNLRLFGLFCEPVIASGGYAGISTTLMDSRGRLFSVVDVAPDALQSARGTYDKPARFADAGICHRDLCRTGLFMQDATASSDGRLGAGKAVKAVRAKAADWCDEIFAELFAEPLRSQLERAYGGYALAPLERSAGFDLLFLRTTIVGLSTAGGLVLVAEDGPTLHGLIPTGHAALDYQSNLELLSRAVGLEILLIGRLKPTEAQTVSLLAFAPNPEQEDGVPQAKLPTSWEGRCNLGLDRVQPSHFAHLPPSAESVALGTPVATDADPLNILRRRLHRVAMGGRQTLSAEVSRVVEREARQLEARMLRGGADVHRGLQHGALAGRRQASGMLTEQAAVGLAEGFVRAGSYERAATGYLQMMQWLGEES